MSQGLDLLLTCLAAVLYALGLNDVATILLFSIVIANLYEIKRQIGERR